MVTLTDRKRVARVCQRKLSFLYKKLLQLTSVSMQMRTIGNWWSRDFDRSDRGTNSVIEQH